MVVGQQSLVMKTRKGKSLKLKKASRTEEMGLKEELQAPSLETLRDFPKEVRERVQTYEIHDRG